MTGLLIFIAIAGVAYLAWKKIPGLKGGTGQACSKPVNSDSGPSARK